MMDVIHYDKYFDIPTRGIVRSDSGVLAFTAHVVEEEEPAELADRPGVYARIRAFSLDDQKLASRFEELEEIFREWRMRFDKRLVDELTHPLLVNHRYQELTRRIDEAFGALGTPHFEATGMMRVVSGKWVFECV
jgi:hypothetical protein